MSEIAPKIDSEPKNVQNDEQQIPEEGKDQVMTCDA